jgi:hypothetical protein
MGTIYRLSISSLNKTFYRFFYIQPILHMITVVNFCFLLQIEKFKN